MPPDVKRSPRQGSESSATVGGTAPILARRADDSRDPSRTQLWAAAWLAADHTDDDACTACSAGWALIGGGRDG